jgi:DNA-binding MarR family transcriptional regulator
VTYAGEQISSYDRIGVLLRLAHSDWRLGIESALQDAGFGDIRPPHSHVFPFVPEEGIQVSRLARLTHTREQSMAQAVSEMEQMGYLERRPHPRDRRARLVFLTERGQAVQPVAIAAGLQVEARWAGLIGRDDLDTLKGLLRELVTKLRED